ncbi:MAG TPA: Fe-S cluster assembly protein SufD [Elainellaceae cyanobacterium]
MSTQATPSLDRPMLAKIDRQAYLSELLNLRSDFDQAALSADAIAWLQEIRSQSADRVRSLSIPTTRDEEWRFTDLSNLLKTHFVSASDPSDVTPSHIRPFILPEAQESRLVFVNGVYAPHLSSLTDLPNGILVGNLTDAKLATSLHSRISSYLGKQNGLDETFTALNTASFNDSAIIWLAKNQIADAPIHVLFVSTSDESPIASFPRCVVIAEPNSAVTFIEDYVTIKEGTCFTDAVTEIWVEENAHVNHCRIQRENEAAFHIGKTAIAQARNARYVSHSVNLGARMSRHNLDVFQTGEQTETTLNGLTLVAGEQLADTHSLISYAAPHGTSKQLHKCIVDDRSHAVFNGKVNVPQAAQLTDAAQLNRNLLLSPKARVDTKPQLEIVADNVKCTHGATVSQLDADEVFYLQSRGIDVASAQNLLIYAFAAEILEQLPVSSLKEMLLKHVAQYGR